MRTCLAFAIVCALGASFAERIPSDGSAPSGDVGVAPFAAVDSAAWIMLPGCADSAPAYAKFRVAFAATDDPVEFDESGGVRARVRSPVPGTFVWRGRTASVAPGETMRIEMKGERQ